MPPRTLAPSHEHDVSVLHYGLSDPRHIFDIAHTTHRPCAARRTVHAAGIKFDHAFFIGQATQSNTVVVGVVFGAGDDQNG